MTLLIAIIGVLQSNSLWSNELPAETEGYFIVGPGYTSGSTWEQVLDSWWTKYRQHYLVDPYGKLKCSYTLEEVNSGSMVVRIEVNGNCGGINHIHRTFVCPADYSLTPQNTCICNDAAAFSSQSGQCLPPSTPPNNGDPGCNGRANPINFTNGNKFQAESDFVGLSREMSLSIRRFYNSNSTHIGVFGQRWHSEFDLAIYFNDEKSRAIVVMGDGKGEVFSLTGDRWSSENHQGNTLNKPSADLWVYRTRKGRVYKYNGDGKITQVINNSGLSWDYSYKNSQLYSVTDSYNTVLLFNFNGPVLESIDTATGTYIYQYTGGLLKAVLLPDDTGNDSKDKARRLYHYEDTSFPYALTGITDEKNIRFSTWGYDEAGRANVSQHHSETYGAVEKFNFDYTFLNDKADPRVTIVSPLAKRSTHHLSTIRGVNQVVWTDGEESTHCASASRFNSFNSTGTLQTKTDWEGNVTLFERDALGRVTKKAEAMKWPAEPMYGVGVDASILQNTANTKVTKTCWHAKHNKPERTIEPASVTIFEYFDNGQLKSQRVQARTSGTVECP